MLPHLLGRTLVIYTRLANDLLSNSLALRINLVLLARSLVLDRRWQVESYIHLHFNLVLGDILEILDHEMQLLDSVVDVLALPSFLIGSHIPDGFGKGRINDFILSLLGA